MQTTCASSHVGLKEKAVVVTSRQEEAAAPVETPEPTPEGSMFIITHTFSQTHTHSLSSGIK